jgi:hypothetical protein
MKISADTHTTSRYPNPDNTAFPADRARAPQQQQQQQPAYDWPKLQAVAAQGPWYERVQTQNARTPFRAPVTLYPALDDIPFGMLPQNPAHSIPNDVLRAFEQARQNPPRGAAQAVTRFRQTLRNLWGR